MEKSGISLFPIKDYSPTANFALMNSSKRLYVKALTTERFTCLPDETLTFPQKGGLTLIVGENGTGKTHLLKLLYVLLRVAYDPKVRTREEYSREYARKLVAVFRPDELGRLVKRGVGKGRCSIRLEFSDPNYTIQLSFASTSRTQVEIGSVPPEKLSISPVYFSVRETISLIPWFIALYDEKDVPFEETWRDTAALLSIPPSRGPKEEAVKKVLRPLSKILGGDLRTDSKTGRFLLYQKGQGQMEMPLLAEGLRKLSMLTQLVRNETLFEQGYLFWDEPESNLNPKLMRVLAKILLDLSRQGTQVFIATHSLFFMREIELLLKQKDYRTTPNRWIGLRVGEKGIELEQGDCPQDISTPITLEEELKQVHQFLSTE